jgi:hypothetical protein
MSMSIEEDIISMPSVRKKKKRLANEVLDTEELAL